MKVVINACFGGFSLSPLATKRLAELQGRKCFFFSSPLMKEPRRQLTLDEATKAFIWHAYDIEDLSVLPSQENWAEMSMEDRRASNQAWEAHGFRDPERHDPLLVQVVEELGEKANVRVSNLKIVEIPDGTDYVIEEYDGNEHIAEKHREWR